MNISDILTSGGDEKHFSFEVLPPLKGTGTERLFSTIEKFCDFNPAYINITTHHSEYVYRELENGQYERLRVRRRPGTVAIAAAIQNKFGVPVIPHIICSGATAEAIEYELIDLQFLGIENVLLLRGDKARDDSQFVPTPGGHAHTTDLIEQVNRFNEGFFNDGTPIKNPGKKFHYGVACYPEKHEEALNMEMDLKYLKMKQDMGADYAVTQLFYDNARFFDYVRRCREAGITVPIIPGIKPLSTVRHLTLLPRTFGCHIPEELEREVLRHKDDPKAVREAGTEWAVAQSRELVEAGVPVLHYYPMGKADNIIKIAKAIF